MAKSKVTITFLTLPINGELLNIQNSEAIGYGDIIETFVPTRLANNQSSIGPSVEISAANLSTAIKFDTANAGIYDVVVSGNIVIVTAKVSNVIFSAAFPNSLSVVIENNTEEVPIEITSQNFSVEISNPCSLIKVNVTTNILATDYYVNNIHYSNSVEPLNPFNFSIIRGANVSLRVIGENLTEYTTHFNTPTVLASENIYFSILNTPTGANVTVNIQEKYLLDLQYSLDSTTWQENNNFSGVIPGNYTMYVKDQYGCIKSKSFTIAVFSPNIATVCPMTYISESMSIRFKEDKLWDNVDVFKTDENTLSCEEDVSIAYKYIQLFTSANVITTQMLSNYEQIIVNAVREDGTRTNIPLTLVKKFVDLKDKRDARIKFVSTDKAGIYYTAGNTYDYNTNVINGAYALNGSLPDYASVGNYVNVNGIGWLLIEDIAYDEITNSDMLIVSTIVSGDTSKIVSSNWNQKNFNVYEFKIDFAYYIDEYIQIEILQNSLSGYGTLNLISEIIEIRETFKDTVEMVWFNYEDSNVFYSTGIKNLGNFLFTSFVSSNDSEVTINKGTDSSVMVNASSYDVKELILSDLSTCIMKQVTQAILHKALTINKLPFLANDPPTSSNIPNTNLYEVTANLVRSRPPYLACQPSGVQIVS